MFSPGFEAVRIFRVHHPLNRACSTVTAASSSSVGSLSFQLSGSSDCSPSSQQQSDKSHGCWTTGDFNKHENGTYMQRSLLGNKRSTQRGHPSGLEQQTAPRLWASGGEPHAANRKYPSKMPGRNRSTCPHDEAWSQTFWSFS